MGMNEYVLYLERPLLRRLRRWKNALKILEICICGVVAILLASYLDMEFSIVVGETFFAAGALPILLSLPLLLARVLNANQDYKRATACPRLKNSVAYGSFGVFLIVGIVLIAKVGDGPSDVVAETVSAFAEVFIIGVITVIFQVPTVEEDETQSLLTTNESLQLERSGTLRAPFAIATDFALNAKHSESLRYLYPAEFECVGESSETDALRTAAENRSHFFFAEDMSNDLSSVSSASLSESASTIHSVFFGTVASEKQHRRLVTKILNSNATGWDCPWYVASLGRCDPNQMGDELMIGLLTCISGSNDSSDRYLTALAATSLGHLFFASGNFKVSRRLIDLWFVHEISSVRDHCELSIKAIGHPACVGFIRAMNAVDQIDASADGVKRYVEIVIGSSVDSSLYLRDPDAFRKCMVECDTLIKVLVVVSACCEWGTSKNVEASNDDRAASKSESYETLETEARRTNERLRSIANTFRSHVLFDAFEYHALKTIALELLCRLTRRSVEIYKRLRIVIGESDHHQMPWRQTIREINGLANSVYTRSVFKSTRIAAMRLMRATEFEYSGIYKLYDPEAVKYYRTQGVSAASIQVRLSKTMPTTLLQKLQRELIELKRPKDDFERLFRPESRTLNADALESDPVMLLYAYIAQDEPSWHPSDLFIVDRLNSPDWIERFCAVLCVARFFDVQDTVPMIVRHVLPRFAKSELISTVRDLVDYVLSLRNPGSWFRSNEIDESKTKGVMALRLAEDEFKALEHRMASPATKATVLNTSFFHISKDAA